MSAPRTAKLREAIVHLGAALNAIEEAGAPTPALYDVVKDLRKSRTDLLSVITNIERAAVAG
jgi:hypothetical protein